jgi:NhaA family Na+:H+ antiporter
VPEGDASTSPLPVADIAPEAWEPLLRVSRLARQPLERFLQIQAASGIVLLVAAAAALAWANSSFAESYRALWHLPVGLRVGPYAFERTLEWFVNDVLMVIFFFVVGLEIKRELHHGELSEWRRAMLPAVAALGGMIAPALTFLLVVGGDPTLRPGWGVPTATDIAFAVGILTLLGPRVPAALRVLLLALAVIDDLGAIVVIALFYSSGVNVAGFMVALAGIGLLMLLQKVGVRAKLVYVLPGAIIWGGIYAGGVHPTIAGVIVGLLTPVRAWLGAEGFVRDAQRALADLSREERLDHAAVATTLRAVNLARREALSPAESIIEVLSPWVAFGIMPVFALANAGVSLDGVSLDGAGGTVAAAAGLGLFLGKPVGIALTCWLLGRFGVVALPAGLGPRHVVVLGIVAGIGFTMALFVAQLAFPGSPGLLGAAKLGVLGGSAAAGIVGLIVGRLLLPLPSPTSAAASTADEAESSTEK